MFTENANRQVKTMPDVAATSAPILGGSLQRVGMSEVEIPVRIQSLLGTSPEMTVPAKADLYVSLDAPEAKGIHMSRLFLTTEDLLAEKPLNFASINELLEQFLKSHQGLSQQAQATFRFDYMTRRPALLSNNSGWRFYPMTLGGVRKDNQTTFEMHIRITYSSTCPCSAALARQIVQERFIERFGEGPIDAAEAAAWLGSEQGITATPHSQRSYAEITLRSKNENFATFPPELINILEDALSTPVQAAVKREDEQEFARLNGENPMFCEDAARKLKLAVEMIDFVDDYRIEARHFESLHPHDAVAIVTKGVEGGLQP